MRTKYTLFCLLIALSFGSKAQTYVTIPDSTFAWNLQMQFPACMIGNQMDITCSGIKNTTYLDMGPTFWGGSRNIHDFTGIGYFTSLRHFNCQENPLTSLPTLPDSLEYLDCNHCQLTSLPSLPSSLINLNVWSNYLTSLPVLPDSLQFLNCEGNLLTNLPILPNTIIQLNCYHNVLTTLPTLPNSLQNLYCEENFLSSLPSLPNSLQHLYCRQNNLTSLPAFPNSLLQIDCSSNLITSIPTLPISLTLLRCDTNLIASLPSLPGSLSYLNCSNNQLTSLPSLPLSLNYLYCSNNNISCFPVFSKPSYSVLDILGNPITCLPNYVTGMNSATLAYPICVEGDSINNPSNCIGVKGVEGYVYDDINTNCLLDSSDLFPSNIHLKLYDNNNNLLAQTYSSSIGIYAFNFLNLTGAYTVKLDTLGLPYTLQCDYPGTDSTVTLSVGTPIVNNVSFNLNCKPGFDIGIHAIMPQWLVFPGLQHKIRVIAGDISNWNNLHCASGISGQVQVTITGPVSFNGIASGALTPAVAGNVFTYNIADFGNVNMQQDFGLLFTTDTAAQSGDQICINVNVTPTAGDNNTSNNNYQFCYQVNNSFDPNVKEVYPVDVMPGFQDYFTYTIHFQNTGTASAMNIRLVDTLNNNLDLETFQVIDYSHNNIVSLNGKILTIRFPNIQLPDSSSNLQGSQGFVQYRIKPKANLPAGAKITNRASIYFDYNAPVLTNTTTNEFLQAVAVMENKSDAILSIYPNPGKGIFNLKMTESGNYKINVYNILGESVYENFQNNKFSDFKIDLSHQANGIYIVRVVGGKQSFNQRIIKQ